MDDKIPPLRAVLLLDSWMKVNLDHPHDTDGGLRLIRMQGRVADLVDNIKSKPSTGEPE
jgi:hypothetical protein